MSRESKTHRNRIWYKENLPAGLGELPFKLDVGEQAQKDKAEKYLYKTVYPALADYLAELQEEGSEEELEEFIEGMVNAWGKVEDLGDLQEVYRKLRYRIEGEEEPKDDDIVSWVPVFENVLVRTNRYNHDIRQGFLRWVYANEPSGPRRYVRAWEEGVISDGAVLVELKELCGLQDNDEYIRRAMEEIGLLSRDRSLGLECWAPHVTYETLILCNETANRAKLDPRTTHDDIAERVRALIAERTETRVA